MKSKKQHEIVEKTTATTTTATATLTTTKTATGTTIWNKMA